MPFNNYPHVYSPIDVGNITLKNRIQFSPIVSKHVDPVSGEVNGDFLAFVGGQAATGAGLVTIGSTPIDFDRARDFYSCLSVTDEINLGGLNLLTREVQKYGCKLSAELTHGGQWAEPISLGEKKAWVPSVIPEYHDPARFEEITRSEMLEVIDNWIKAADLCLRSGFDMIMMHLAHGNLLSSFLSPAFNTRTDKYGGSPENRWRYPLEVLEAVSSHINGRIPIEARVVGNEYLTNGATLSERIDFLKEAEKYIDMIVVSAGTLYIPSSTKYNMPGYYVEAGLNVPYAAEMKAALDIPVSVVGGISTLEHAEDIIASGKADIVAMAKALMADEGMVIKGERGQDDDIRPCMRCMYCLKNTNKAHLAGCAVNPRFGWEYRYLKVNPAYKKKKIMVIGGGPGGMKATRMLTERGYEVVLYEKQEKLGGRLPEASALYLKEGFRRYYEYAVRKTMSCGAKIVLGTEANVDIIKNENPDALIIACGAELIVPGIKGVDLPNITDVVAVDQGKKEIGNKVVICGAGVSGSECALELSRSGKEVTLVDMRPKDELCAEMFGLGRLMLFDGLEENNVTILDSHKILEFTENGVVLSSDKESNFLLEADDIVLAIGVKPNTEMINELADVIPETYIIGDANKAGLIGDSIREAFNVCYDL